MVELNGVGIGVSCLVGLVTTSLDRPPSPAVVVGVGVERGCVYCGVAEAVTVAEVPPRL